LRRRGGREAVGYQGGGGGSSREDEAAPQKRGSHCDDSRVEGCTILLEDPLFRVIVFSLLL
jgi:hypothetical protein